MYEINTINKCLLIIDIQNYTLERQEAGVKLCRIYQDMNEKYHISLSTFRNYLNYNAKKRLKELEAKKGGTNNA